MLHRVDVGLVLTDTKIQVLWPCICYQYFYNEKTNKAFIQFDIYNDKKLFNRNKLYALIARRINNQFWLDTNVFPELMNPYTRVKLKNTDTAYSITPYTIGYWRSMYGYWEILEDKAEVELDLKAKYLKPELKDITIMDLYNKAEEISRRYNLLRERISDQNKEIYITRSYEILQQYKDDDEMYKQKMHELNSTYNPYGYNNNNIPNAATEYREWYTSIFNTKLCDTEKFTNRYFYQMTNI
jgi:hypothetical protein